jgi:hypothetical protein
VNGASATGKMERPEIRREKQVGLSFRVRAAFVISHVNVLPSRLSERTSDDWIKRVITGDGNKQTK